MASIRERNGKFNVIYSYTNEKGERKQKWETYETKAEAKRRKKEIEYKKEMGSFVVRKCKTLDELITEYVALYGNEYIYPGLFMSAVNNPGLCYQLSDFFNK